MMGQKQTNAPFYYGNKRTLLVLRQTKRTLVGDSQTRRSLGWVCCNPNPPLGGAETVVIGSGEMAMAWRWRRRLMLMVMVVADLAASGDEDDEMKVVRWWREGVGRSGGCGVSVGVAGWGRRHRKTFWGGRRGISVARVIEKMMKTPNGL
nr:hypothetical protein [Tanacetum cinerariifolium]